MKRALIILAAFSAILFLAGSCSSVRRITRDDSLQEELVRIAKSKLGCRYAYGAKGPESFDCSGFMIYVFGKKGIQLQASSKVQYTQGRAVAPGEALQPGDLVFFSGRKKSDDVGHVGMVLDYDGKTDEFTFIHASTSAGIEVQSSKTPYYAERYIGARRIIGTQDLP